MMWSRSREAKNIAIHGCNNKIKIITTIHIVSQDHAISAMKRLKLLLNFEKVMGKEKIIIELKPLRIEDYLTKSPQDQQHQHMMWVHL